MKDIEKELEELKELTLGLVDSIRRLGRLLSELEDKIDSIDVKEDRSLKK